MVQLQPAVRFSNKDYFNFKPVRTDFQDDKKMIVLNSWASPFSTTYHSSSSDGLLFAVHLLDGPVHINGADFNYIYLYLLPTFQRWQTKT